MKPVRIPGPDIPALVVIALMLQLPPVVVELMSKWNHLAPEPLRVVFLGW